MQNTWGFPDGSVVNNLPVNTGDAGSTPGSRRSPGKGNGNPLRYTCLENPTDKGVWWATVHGVRKRWTWLSTHSSMQNTTQSIWQLVHKSSTNRYHFSISCLIWIPSIISFFLIAWLEPLVKCWLEEAENSHFRLENSHFLISNLLQSYSNSDSIVQELTYNQWNKIKSPNSHIYG